MSGADWVDHRRVPSSPRSGAGPYVSRLVAGEDLSELVQPDVAGHSNAGGVLGAKPSAQQPHHGLGRTIEAGRWGIEIAGHSNRGGDLDAAARDRQADFPLDLVGVPGKAQQESQWSSEELDEYLGRARVHGRRRVDPDAHVPRVVGDLVEPHAKRDHQGHGFGEEDLPSWGPEYGRT